VVPLVALRINNVRRSLGMGPLLSKNSVRANKNGIHLRKPCVQIVLSVMKKIV